jgi:hypothetical protein
MWAESYSLDRGIKEGTEDPGSWRLTKGIDEEEGEGVEEVVVVGIDDDKGG